VTGALVPPCPRCGAAVSVHHPRLEHLPMYGWRLFGVASAVNYCGHRQEWLVLSATAFAVGACLLGGVAFGLFVLIDRLRGPRPPRHKTTS
jgi:hypothetical protein